MIPLIGFAPDADPVTPGVMTDCIQLVPSERGMVAAPSGVSVTGVPALAAECRGAAVTVDTSGTRRTFAATQTAIYELVGTTWTDRSRAGGYTGSAENRVMFAQFGNATLAANESEVLQASTSGAFADISGAPKARIVVTLANHVIAMDIDDASGDDADGWRTAAFQTHTSWTLDGNAQAVRGRLIGNGGPILAGMRLGEQVVAYKESSVFVGTPAGAPIAIQWQQVPGEIGCVGPEAVDDIGTGHVFVGQDDIWFFDGTRPVPIARGVTRQWFFDNSSPTYRYRTIVRYDRQSGRVWIFYPSTSSTTGQPDSALVWHVASKKWGRANRNVEAVFSFVTPGLTWDTFDTVAATWDGLPSVPWDSQSWSPSGRALAVFDTSHTIKTLNGTGEASGFTTGDFGDDSDVSFVSATRIRFINDPDTATCTGYSKLEAGKPFAVSSSSTIGDGKFDMRQSGRFHRFSYTFTGDLEVTAHRIDARPAGAR